MQKDRLHEEFAAAANAFQEIQRHELKKEKEEVRRARANSNIAPPPSSKDIFGGMGLFLTFVLCIHCLLCL